MNRWPRRFFVSATLALTLVAPLAARADFSFSLDPRATYLRVNNDAALDAVPIDLLSIGVDPGDTIVISRLGDYVRGAAPFNIDEWLDMAGVFSSSAILGPAGDLNRVVGAIDTGTDFFTSPTFSGGLPTDIPQDFQISNFAGTLTSVTIEVPIGAQYLFVGPFDVFFQDNLDPNANYGVGIAVVPEAGSAVVLLLGLVTLAGCRIRHRRI